jgi:hypothetical protein
MSSTAAETAVTVTILTRLCVAIDSDWDMDVRVRSVFFLRFGFCDARIAFPRRRVRLFGSLTLTLSLSRFVPDLHPPWHAFERERLRGLVNQS